MTSGDRSKHIGLSNISIKSDDVAQYYDDWAGDYDGTLADWRYEAPEHVAALLRSKLSVDAVILDAGCGTGLSGQALHTSGFTMIDGIDVSPRSLEIAGKTNVYRSLQTMDLQRLPSSISDDQYGGLACVGVLTYLTDSVGTLREFCRVVKSGGVVVVTQRSDLLTERDYQGVLEGLLGKGVIAQLHISDQRPYLPENEKFADQTLIHYIIFIVV
jgi:predicted TPR repeat methyltransferase